MLFNAVKYWLRPFRAKVKPYKKYVNRLKTQKLKKLWTKFFKVCFLCWILLAPAGFMNGHNLSGIFWTIQAAVLYKYREQVLIEYRNLYNNKAAC